MKSAEVDQSPDAASHSTRSQPAVHAMAWMSWVAGVLISLTLSRNPFYVGLVLAATGAVLVRCGKPPVEDATTPVITPLRFGLVVVATAAVFNGAMVHFGATVLFALPAWIPLLGGPITAEALLYGALNGAALAGLFSAFTVINRVVPVRALLRLVPRAFYPVAVVMSIAVSFVPTTLQQVQQIREAQAVRGHRLRGVRTWLPLVIPLLEGGMERSLQLAEAMMARGFAGSEGADSPWPQVTVLAGFGVIVVGWLLQVIWRQLFAGAFLLTAGLIVLVVGLWLAGRRHPHTVYQPDAWHGQDWLIAGGVLLAVLFYAAPLPGIDRVSLEYYPYPAVQWPAFDWRIGLATLGLATPALLSLVEDLP